MYELKINEWAILKSGDGRPHDKLAQIIDCRHGMFVVENDNGIFEVTRDDLQPLG